MAQPLLPELTVSNHGTTPNKGYLLPIRVITPKYTATEREFVRDLDVEMSVSMLSTAANLLAWKAKRSFLDHCVVVYYTCEIWDMPAVAFERGQRKPSLASYAT